MKRHLLSVIVPVYNVEKYLNRCVLSILKQKYENMEIILVDDGSKDSSGMICDQLAREDSRIKVLHKENGGLSSARNAGLSCAQGRYISFIDSDDYIDPDMYAVMINAMEQTDSDIAACGRHDEYESKRSLNFTMDSTTVFSAVETMRRILSWDQIDISACDKVYKAELWNAVRFPEGKNNEDICTIPAIIKAAGSIVHIGDAKYHYYHRAESITTTYNEKKIKDFFHAIEFIQGFSQKHYPQIKDELVFYLNSTYLSLLMICNRVKYEGQEQKVAASYLKKNWKNRFSRKRMSRNQKLAYFLIKTNLYRFVICLKRKIKH